MYGTVQMRLDITRDDAWEDLDGEKLQERLGDREVTQWVVERNKNAGAVTHRIVGDTEGAAMYRRGKQDPCTLR